MGRKRVREKEERKRGKWKGVREIYRKEERGRKGRKGRREEDR